MTDRRDEGTTGYRILGSNEAKRSGVATKKPCPPVLIVLDSDRQLGIQTGRYLAD